MSQHRSCLNRSCLKRSCLKCSCAIGPIESIVAGAMRITTASCETLAFDGAFGPDLFVSVSQNDYNIKQKVLAALAAFYVRSSTCYGISALFVMASDLACFVLLT